MGTWSRSKEFLFVEWLIYLQAIVCIFYVLVRHTLLVNAKLLPDTVECGSCISAFFAALCGEQRDAPPPTRRTNRGGHKFHKRVVFYGTFVSVVFYLLFCVNDAALYLAMFGWLFPYCTKAVSVSTVLFVNAKYSMYAVFVGRLFLGFQESAYGYRKRTIHLLYACIVVGYVIANVLAVTSVRGQRASNGYFCVAKAPDFCYAFGVLFDFAFCGTVVFLFTAALKKMLANSARTLDERHRAKDRNDNPELHLLPLKYTLITIVAILSTTVAWTLYGTTGIAFFCCVDCVVNCFALVLMTTKWKPVYLQLCTPLLSCVVHVSCVPCADPTKVELVAVVVERHRALSLSRSRSNSKPVSPISVPTK